MLENPPSVLQECAKCRAIVLPLVYNLPSSCEQQIHSSHGFAVFFHLATYSTNISLSIMLIKSFFQVQAESLDWLFQVRT
jgi:hypothetical protein